MNEGIGFNGLGLNDWPLIGSKRLTQITDSRGVRQSVGASLMLRISLSAPSPPRRDESRALAWEHHR